MNTSKKKIRNHGSSPGTARIRVHLNPILPAPYRTENVYPERTYTVIIYMFFVL